MLKNLISSSSIARLSKVGAKLSLYSLLIVTTLATATATHADGKKKSSQDEFVEGLLIFGGMLAAGALLHEVLNDDHKPHKVHHKPHKPHKPKPHIQPINHRKMARRQNAINLCSNVATQQAYNSGFSTAWVSNIKKAARMDSGGWKVKGQVTHQYQKWIGGHNRRHSNLWNNGWNTSWNNGWNQGRYVTKTETAKFSCKVRRGQVVSFNQR